VSYILSTTLIAFPFTEILISLIFPPLFIYPCPYSFPVDFSFSSEPVEKHRYQYFMEIKQQRELKFSSNFNFLYNENEKNIFQRIPFTARWQWQTSVSPPADFRRKGK
jgi:hypothetical protein